MRAVRLITTLTSLALLSACIPMVESYYRLDREGSKYFGEICVSTVGTPSIIYFPFEEIFLFASVDQKPHLAELGIQVPLGHVVQVLDKSITIAYELNGQIESVPVPLQPARLPRDKYNPVRDSAPTDPYGKEDYFGVLTGDTATIKWPFLFVFEGESVGHKTYLFHAEFQRRSEAGSITFPTMRIDGRLFPGPRLPFKKDTRVSIYPLNC